MPLYADTKVDSLQDLFARQDLVKGMGGTLFEAPAGTGERFCWRFDVSLSLTDQQALGVTEMDFNVRGDRRCYLDGCWYATRTDAALHLRDCGWKLNEAAAYMCALPEIAYPFPT